MKKMWLMIVSVLMAFAVGRVRAEESIIIEGETSENIEVKNDSRASGRKVASRLERGKPVVFKGVTVEKDSVYSLKLETFDNQTRKIFLSVNGAKARERKISPGYDNTAGVGIWEEKLKKGENTIEITGDDLPDIDRLVITRILSVAEAPGRAEVKLNSNWEFRWGKSGARRRNDDLRMTNDKTDGWKIVDLPHDAQFERPWSQKDSSGARGFKPMGEMWYRKSFRVEDLKGINVEGRRVFLEFGGIMCVGDVYLNGKKVGETDYGYLPVWCDITDKLNKTGENFIEVWCSTGRREGSRWYTGAGLYRDAKIVVKPSISIARHGVFVRSSVDLEKKNAEVEVSVELDGFEKRGRNEKLEVVVQLKDKKGKIAAEAKARAEWSKNAHQEVLLPKMNIDDVKLWDIDDPNLYTADVKLVYDGVEIDREEVQFGVRSIELDYEYGMKLNGRKIFLNSISGHHDLGCVGAAAYKRAIRRQFELLKKFGYNAIRCSHNPYSEDFYELADEMGILVVDELVDKWTDTSYWFGRKPFTTIWPKLVTTWMKRDRNHPSIFAWSFGNELQMRDDLCGYADVNDWGVTMYRVIKAFSQRWDTTRPTTVAMFPSRKGAVYKNDPGFNDDPEAPEMSLITDFASYNYQWQAYASYIKHAPGLNIFQSEAVVNELQAPYLGMDRDHSIGCSYWGAIEYWGESNGWPKKGWNYAFFSHTLEPYPSAYLIKSVMDESPIVRIACETGKGSSVMWNDVLVGRTEEASAWEGKKGEKKNIRVYTNTKAVELFLNGKSLGKKSNDSTEPSIKNILSWEVEFEEGELKAVATDGSAQHSIQTAGKAERLQIEVEANDYKADGEDLIYVRCRAVDSNGVQVRSWEGNVEVACSGAAKFLCLDNGDHYTDELFTSDISAKKAKEGFILAVFRCGTTPGEATIEIKAEGLGEENVRVEVGRL
ncbi:MAG: DUF4982 domain-containing protein [Kiritimatiellae bacterium]|nr:DUF4982 domain-containing protein [Kiritimatiellia bacterium]